MKILSLVTLSFFVLGYFYLSRPAPKNAQENEVVVYQSRTCGCCKKWVAHLEENGFKVRSELVEDVTAVKLKMNLPMKLASCHTAVVNGYIVEGHVPASAVKKLLAERPVVKGISVPGMPAGSPGMESHYKENYNVVAFDNNGNERIYLQY